MRGPSFWPLSPLADAVITTDSDGQITYINAAAHELLGQSLDAIEGRKFYDVVAMTDPRTSRIAQPTLGCCYLPVAAFYFAPNAFINR